MTDDETSDTAAIAHHNEVIVIGRLSTAALSRELPSGDCLMTWRLVVNRSPTPRRRGDGRGQDYDLIDCISFSGRVRTAAGRWAVGDIIEVRGALRRRFWRAAGGALQSCCELEAVAARRLAKAGGQVTGRRKTG